MTEYEEAVALATSAHAGQVYHATTGDVPYIQHCLWVADLLDDPTDKVVALLHDIFEDTDTDPDQVEKLFGPEVYQTLIALTRKESESYFRYIRRCIVDKRARRVKKADLRVNLRNCDGRDEHNISLALRYDKALAFIQVKDELEKETES